MTSSKQSYKYGTPDKQLNTQIKQFSYSTTVKKSDSKVSPNINSQRYSSSNRYAPGLTIEQLRNEKLAWYQMKIEELRTYIDSNNQIDKRVLKRIFQWSDLMPEENRESHFLRELNIKVKNLINENNELRQNVHTKDLQKLKHENIRLQKMIMQFQRGQTVRQTSLDEENRYLRNYINQKTINKTQFIDYQSGAKQQEGTQQINLINRNVRRTNLIDNKLEMIIQNKSNSEENFSNMKRFFTNYINAVKQQNDNKLQAQSRYIDTLQKKVKYLEEQVKIKFNQFKFERKVHLQNSVRKSKNFSVEIPFIRGEQDRLQDVNQECLGNVYVKSSIKKGLISDRPYFVQQRISEKQSVQTLKLRIKQLQGDYQYLQKKYAIEIQNHIRDTASREEALMKVQKLTIEIKGLTSKIYQMSLELKNNEKKINQNQLRSIQKKELTTSANNTIISSYTANNVVQELKQIRQEIQSCNKNYSKEAEKVINKLVIERDQLRRQLNQMKKNSLKQFENSTLQKQIFLLKNQNVQLEKNCRFYQKQIEEYSAQLNDLKRQNKSRILNGFQQQSIDISEQGKLGTVGV